MSKDQYLYNGVIKRETMKPSKNKEVKRMGASNPKSEGYD